MSFHLDLEFAGDCAVWREMLHHETLVEKQSVGALAGTYGRLPPAVLSKFLTHRHTHERLLPPREQQMLQEALESSTFSFNGSPSYALYERSSNLDRASLYALTHSMYADTGADGSLHGKHPHTFLAEQFPHAYPQRLPTHAALHYLHPPDSTARLNGGPAINGGGAHSLYPRAAKSYAQGPYYESHLPMAAPPADPHPSLLAHPETSTYRRATHGRRHHPFPRAIPLGAQEAPPAYAAAVSRPAQSLQQQQQEQQKHEEESKSNATHTQQQQQQHSFHRGVRYADPLPPSGSLSARPSPTSAPPLQPSIGGFMPRPPPSRDAAPPGSASVPPQRGGWTAHSHPNQLSQQADRFSGGHTGAATARVAPSPPAMRNSGNVTRADAVALPATAYAAPAVPLSLPVPPATSAPAAGSLVARAPLGSLGRDDTVGGGLSVVTRPHVSHPSRVGFAPLASPAPAGSAAAASSLRGSPRPAQQSLLSTLPMSYAAHAQHAYDHRAGFGGARGVFSVEPRAKADQGLHASSVGW